MAKPIPVKKAHKMLKKAGCVKLRNRRHETWQRKDGHIFALPANGSEVSVGISRQLEYFISNSSLTRLLGKKEND